MPLSKLRKATRGLSAAVMLVSCVMSADAAADTLTIGTRSEMTMDPHFFWSTPNRAYNVHLYGSLVRLNNAMRTQPMIASKWILVDETTWDFKIDPAARFHNGSKVTAKDVEASFKRASTLENAAASYKGALRGVASVTAIDTDTVRVKTKKANPALLHQVAQISIIPANIAVSANQGDFISGKAAIGAGPYKFVRFKAGDRLVLERNEAYFGPKAKWDKVVFRVISDDAARVAALLGGDVDLIDYVPPSDVARLKRESGIKVFRSTSDRTMFLIPDVGRNVSPFVTDKDGESMNKNPLQDVRVRKAMAMAIDRKSLVARIMDGAGTPANQNVAPDVLGHAAALPGIKYDVSAAKKLLAEAGYPNGFGLTIHCTNDRYVNDARICQALGQMLARLGLKMKVEALPKAVMFPRIRDPKGDRTSLMLLSFGSGTSGDAGGTLTHTIHTFDKGRGFGTWNVGRYSNANVDAVIEKAVTTLRANDRAKLQSKAISLAIADMAVIPLFYNNVIVASRKGLSYTIYADQSTIADAAVPAN
ncbi:MAG: ABC transporter substrate-binding protein [Alphaproteobacteria bacterium]|nr:ABC transporter substrate-binding protein [Alphaproteobacteria bacterium]